MKLRNYQQAQVDQIWKDPQDSPLIQAPTGTGKGNQITYLLRELAVIQNQKVVVIVPTYYLLSNIYDRFLSCYPALFWSISIKWQDTTNKNILVTTYQALNRHLNCFDPDWIIVDEAHISANQSVINILNHYKKPTIGFTATPTRLSGEALSMFDRLILPTLSNQEFTDQGYIADFDLYTLRNPDIDSLITDSFGDNLASQQQLLSTELSVQSQSILWAKYALGLKTIFFVAGREQGLALKQYLNSKYDRYYFEYIDSTMSYAQRDQILEDFRLGKITGVINIELLILGVNVPDCQCVFTARATQSLTYWLQFVGRCLRPKVDRSKGIIIDPVGNALRLGSPSFDHEWTLDGISNQQRISNQFCCSECSMPLVTKTKVAQFNREGYQCFCPNCATENWFIHSISKPYYQKYKSKKKKVVIDLEKFEVDQLNWEIHRVISDKKLDQVVKRRYILNSQLSQQQKRSALLYIGEKPDVVEMLLS